MIRSAVFSVALIHFSASMLFSRALADADMADHASALSTAYAALQRGDARAAKGSLATTKESLRGTPFRLLEQLAAHRDPKHAITGSAVPKPENRYAIAVMHPTEPRVAYLCDQGIVVVYDLSEAHAEPARIVSSRAKPLIYGSFSADGTSFGAGDTEGGMLVWDTRSWKERASYVKGNQPVRYVSIDKHGEKLLAETEHGVVLWDIHGDKEIGVVADRYNFGTALCFSNDQHHFATGGLYSVQIHDAKTGETIREIRHAPYTMHLCFSPDSRYIASGLRGSLNKWLGVFDVATGETVFDRAKHDKGITGIVFLDNGKCLLSTAADGTMKFWHVPSGTELLTMRMSESIYQPSSTVDSTAILWNQRSGPRCFSLK